MNWGYDAQENKYTNLVSAGIIDPTKVVRTALQDASSVAGLLITTEAMVADAPEDKPAAAMPDMGGMGGGMGGMGGGMGMMSLPPSPRSKDPGQGVFDNKAVKKASGKKKRRFGPVIGR